MSMPPPRQLSRGKSSSSLMNEGKKKPLKQFTAGGIKAHNRNSSYGQLNKLNKLSKIPSSESVDDHEELRPTMSRSKSSDGVVLKRNRSKRKLLGLLPLTRTASNQSYKGNNIKVKLSKSQGTMDDESEEEVESFDDQVDGTESVQQPPPQLPQSTNSMPKFFNNILSQSTGTERLIKPGGEPMSGMANGTGTHMYPQQTDSNPGIVRYPSKNSLDQIQESSNEQQQRQYASRNAHHMARDSHDNSTTSLLSANLIFQPSSTNIDRHYHNLASAAVGKVDSPDSSASLAADFTKNFREFLNKTPELETRTQQKLWLQRENSILDLSYSTKNYQLNNAQFKTEFEKYSREYLNVRRHVNPVLGSLKRLELGGCRISQPDDKNKPVTSFKSFAPGMTEKIRENHEELNRIWETRWKDHNTSSRSLDNLSTSVRQEHVPQHSQHPQQHPQQQSTQQYFQQRPKPLNKSSNNITLSSPHLPMTKAVAKNGGVSII